MNKVTQNRDKALAGQFVATARSAKSLFMPISPGSTKSPGSPKSMPLDEAKRRLQTRATGAAKRRQWARWEGSTMRWCPVLVLAALVLATIGSEGSAQIFGSKKPKTPPQQRVPELIDILKTEKNDHKRSQAAEELRQFDAKDFPEIIPVLIEALQSDSAASVRIEAATGLGRLRPVTVPAGQALEKAVGDDANLRVRLQAKASLVYYQLSGYHAPKKGEPPVTAGKTTTDEPPLAVGNEHLWKVNKTSPTAPPTSRPLPSAPPANPAVPSTPPAASGNGPMLQPDPTWTQGPRLSPP
jgi:hypothetical protein